MAFPYTPIYAGAFVPVGNCVTLTAATTPPAAVQVVQTVARIYWYYGGAWLVEAGV